MTVETHGVSLKAVNSNDGLVLKKGYWVFTIQGRSVSYRSQSMFSTSWNSPFRASARKEGISPLRKQWGHNSQFSENSLT